MITLSPGTRMQLAPSSCCIALILLGAACRQQASAPAPRLLAAAAGPCWWTVLRSPLPLDAVATGVVNAFTTLGLTNVSSAQQGDTIRVQAGPTRLADWYGDTFLAGVVAFRHGDSTLFRYFVAPAPPPGGWSPSRDSVTATGTHVIVNPEGRMVGLCAGISNIAKIDHTAPQAPNGEESMAVWRLQ